jgi:ABC-type uncharacterized transport system substrate-binding protein
MTSQFTSLVTSSAISSSKQSTGTNSAIINQFSTSSAEKAISETTSSPVIAAATLAPSNATQSKGELEYIRS